MNINAATLGEALIALCESPSRDRSITHINAADDELQITYAELYKRALHVLFHLQVAGMEPGNQLLICTPSNEQFLDAFWACQLGGITAVPVAVGHSHEHRRRFFNVFKRLENGYVFSNRATLEPMQVFAESQGLEDEFAVLHKRSIAANELTVDMQRGTLTQTDADSYALYQFSSGSTGTPKGVMLTHKNIISNIRGIVTAALFCDADSFLSWMPLYHDMGLIGFHLVPLLVGIDQHILRTALFVRRPLLWLNKASEKAATILSSPNFGLHLLLRSATAKGAEERLADLNLSHVRLLFNGAETISAPLCEEFSTTLEPYGLKRNAIFPVYGLAEASLAVSFPEVGAPVQTLDVARQSLNVGERVQPSKSTSDQIRLVALGSTVPGCELRIIDEDNRPLDADHVGHIQIRGENVSRGYYGETAHAEQSGDEWFDTGDLGVLSDQLYVVGRSKETMILNGVTYHPHDLEAVCEEVEGVGSQRAACTSVYVPESGSESVLVFIVFRGAIENFVPTVVKLRRALHERAFIDPLKVIPIRTLPKTTSGKLQRFVLREAYSNGEFDAVLADLDTAMTEATGFTKTEARTDVERTLLDICRSIITTEEVYLEDDLLDMGTSSLALVEICEAVDECYPGIIELAEFLEHTSVASLASHLEEKLQHV
ncbi:MAG: AMP-dependent synthetase [Gammaproteobacteria bacterium]|nr:MAG: AMP-dependent synthetase [Gammaproteobacteria bacterium]